MKGSSIRILLLTLLIGVLVASWADVVYLKSGGKLEGRIVQQTETSVEVDIGAGNMTVPTSSVDRIEEGRSQLDEFDQRAAALDPNDRDGWLQLASWASRAGLGTQSQAREAEARAREAEASAQQPTYGIPLYWNTWGPGPSTWPTNPLDQGRSPGRSGGQP